ncbi:MAG: acylneuraminate cytidylyltransferase family protein [Vicinamibacterales bacterium]
MSVRTAAIVPMRHESERVPGKNYRPLAGRPLYHHVVASLLDCPGISEVVIDTDSPLIRADAGERFPSVAVIERPEQLRDGSIPMNEILLNDIQQIQADLYLQTHSTNPFLTALTIGRALEALASKPDHDSLFSVTRLQARLWREGAIQVNHNPAHLLRTQDLEPIFLENSCIYLFTAESLRSQGNRIGQRPLMFEISADEALDIDDEWDFQLAETMVKMREGK